MFEPPDYYRNLSLRLSEVLDDIGVNERLVMKRRRISMISETMQNMEFHIDNEHNELPIKFNFGSRTEATTTLGLQSDFDTLLCEKEMNVIQDWSDWEPEKEQLLMVQDESTAPGYCLLQWARTDVPMPMQDLQHQYFFTDDRGMVFLRHSLFLNESGVRHGPAESFKFGPGVESDTVVGLRCSWPKEAFPWLEQQHIGGWPTADMKRYSAEQWCFVVPVGSRNGAYGDLEWRISTSLAERCLMFSLNMIQIRCYILMKMILKDFIKPRCDEAISSFMCKNILFYCIADSRPSEWRDCNLVTCFTRCLQVLFNCVLTENCPHFIIPKNNLVAGKLSPGIKQRLVEIMCTLTENIEQGLLGISIDDLGQRIIVKSGHICRDYLPSAVEISVVVSEHNINELSGMLYALMDKIMMNISNNNVSVYESLVQNVYRMCQAYLSGSTIEQASVKLLTPFLCSIVASVMASTDIHRFRALSPEALWWFSAGLNSDFSSSRLKLASALYCAGDLDRCEVLLADLDRRVGPEIVLNACLCYDHEFFVSNTYGRFCFQRNEDVIKHNRAFCVRFLKCEVNCIPAELKFELFKPTLDGLPYRTEIDDWMDWAVVDSLSYLYFLQYKVYSQLRRSADKNRALDNLAMTIGTEPNLGHRETALNLLGQCMEQENRKEDALRCFMLSMKERGRNNAAIWHVCILLAAMLQQQTDP